MNWCEICQCDLRWCSCHKQATFNPDWASPLIAGTEPLTDELALLLAANAHAYGRDFCRAYVDTDSPLSFEEKECVARGWKR